MESGFKIAVIGLGLIGGSLAYALRGFKKAGIAGCDIDPATRAAAIKNKAVSAAYDNAGDAIDGADLVVFCTCPDIIGKLIEENKSRFKPGAVVSDVCGVKSRVSKQIPAALPDNVDYVGGHPMAGKEVDGFENASSGEIYRRDADRCGRSRGARPRDRLYQRSHACGGLGPVP